MENSNVVGVGFEKHPKLKYCAVFHFADEFEDTSDSSSVSGEDISPRYQQGNINLQIDQHEEEEYNELKGPCATNNTSNFRNHYKHMDSKKKSISPIKNPLPVKVLNKKSNNLNLHF